MRDDIIEAVEFLDMESLKDCDRNYILSAAFEDEDIAEYILEYL